MDHQCCSKDLAKNEIDFQIEKVVDKPKTPSWSPSTYEDFKPFLLSDEDPWKVKSTFNTKTILIRENYDKEIAKKHQQMAKMVRKRKPDDDDGKKTFKARKRYERKENCQ